jgi:GNAT superfamily N-acetyltransferase
LCERTIRRISALTGRTEHVDFVGKHYEENDVNLTISDFNGRQDIPKVKAFLRGREKWESLPDYWTAGKSTVGTFHAIFDSPTSHHKFWQDEKGDYVAYLWLHPEPSETIEGNGNSWRVMIHPQFRSTEVAGSAIDYAEDQLLQLADQTSKPMETVCYGEDCWLASLLHERGYIKQEALEVYMQRSLDDPIGSPDLLDDYTIRPLDTESDIVQRAGVQSDAFAGQPEPGEWAIENTERFLRWYEERDDLDLVAVSTTGEIAAFAVFLIDPVTQVGELDPVGTRESHQRKGLSKTILLSGLQYMKSKKMKFAAVRTGLGNAPAIHAYESVGFRVVDHLYRYTKE